MLTTEQRQNLLDKINKGDWDKDTAIALGDLISSHFDEAVQSNPTAKLAEILQNHFFNNIDIKDKSILTAAQAVMVQVTIYPKYQGKTQYQIWKDLLEAKPNWFIKFLARLGLSWAQNRIKTEQEEKAKLFYKAVKKAKPFANKEEAAKRLFKEIRNYKIPAKLYNENGSLNEVGIATKQHDSKKSYDRNTKEHYYKKGETFSPYYHVLGAEITKILTLHLSDEKAEYRLLVDGGKVKENVGISKKIGWNHDKKKHDKIRSLGGHANHETYEYYSLLIAALVRCDIDAHDDNMIMNEQTNHLTNIDIEINFDSDLASFLQRWNHTKHTFVSMMGEEIWTRAFKDFSENFNTQKENLRIHINSILEAFQDKGFYLKTTNGAIIRADNIISDIQDNLSIIQEYKSAQFDKAKQQSTGLSM